MDREIADIRRRAGLNEQETFDMASHDQLVEFLDDEIEFLEKLARVLAPAMAPDRARKILAVIGDRRNRLQQFGRQAQSQARSAKTQQGTAEYQATASGGEAPVGGNINTRA